MPRITITGVDLQVDGIYDLDLEDTFTGDELHLIKKHSGVRAGEIGEAMEAGDYDLIICLAKIAMDRSGKDVRIERLLAAKIGSLQFGQTDAEKEAEQEADDLPPVSAPSGANENESETNTSGPSIENGSAQTLVSGRADIGDPDLLTGSGYSRGT